jgi:F-type H+-transporting ATPase subunit gamma
MSESIDSLHRQIGAAGNLQTVVRAMKAITAAAIGQYEQAVGALSDYDRTIALGLGACLRRRAAPDADRIGSMRRAAPAVGAIVFGSDQGLVGQFNEVIAAHVIEQLATLPGRAFVWAVGERVHARLAESGLPLLGLYQLPNAVAGIAPLVTQLQLACERQIATGRYAEVLVFHNRPRPGAGYDPSRLRLLPLDDEWQKRLSAIPWPTRTAPEIMLEDQGALHALVREHLFISLFRACAESLASENASRLAAMERAEKNIDDVLVGMHASYHRLRQSGIDGELFDVIAGFEAHAG